MRNQCQDCFLAPVNLQHLCDTVYLQHLCNIVCLQHLCDTVYLQHLCDTVYLQHLCNTVFLQHLCDTVYLQQLSICNTFATLSICNTFESLSTCNTFATLSICNTFESLSICNTFAQVSSHDDEQARCGPWFKGESFFTLNTCEGSWCLNGAVFLTRHSCAVAHRKCQCQFPHAGRATHCADEALMLYVVTFNLFVYSCNVTCNWSCDTSGRCCEGGIPYFGSLTLELTQAWQMRLWTHSSLANENSLNLGKCAWGQRQSDLLLVIILLLTLCRTLLFWPFDL